MVHQSEHKCRSPSFLAVSFTEWVDLDRRLEGALGSMVAFEVHCSECLADHSPVDPHVTKTDSELREC